MSLGTTLFVFWLVMIAGWLAGWIMRGWFLHRSDDD